MELVRYVLTDPQSDCEWVRRDLDEMIAIAERGSATAVPPKPSNLLGRERRPHTSH